MEFTKRYAWATLSNTSWFIKLSEVLNSFKALRSDLPVTRLGVFKFDAEFSNLFLKLFISLNNLACISNNPFNHCLAKISVESATKKTKLCLCALGVRAEYFRTLGVRTRGVRQQVSCKREKLWRAAAAASPSPRFGRRKCDEQSVNLLGSEGTRVPQTYTASISGE